MVKIGADPPPGSLHAEYLASEALRIADIPADVILMQVRPPVPQQMLPPRFGYPTNALTIDDVLDINRWQPKFRQFTSGLGAIVRTPPDRNEFVEDVWSGSSRNSLGNV